MYLSLGFVIFAKEEFPDKRKRRKVSVSFPYPVKNSCNSKLFSGHTTWTVESAF